MSIPPSKVSFSDHARSLGLGDERVARHRSGGRRPILEEDLERRDATFAKMWERNEGELRDRAEARSRRVLDELRKGRGGRQV